MQQGDKLYTGRGKYLSKLLMDERPLVVLPSLAKLIGLNEAIVVQQIHYWLQNKPNIRDGIRWTYNTYEGWAKQFPWWSESTVKRTIKKLESDGLLITTANYNKMKIDNTKWYSINYDKLNELHTTDESDRPSGQIDQTSGSDWTDTSGQNDQANTLDYPETNFIPVRGDKLPEIQRPTAILFINESGKEGLDEDDVICLNMLFKMHTPAAIQKTMMDSFKRLDKNGLVTCDEQEITSRKEMPMRYIYNSMKNWTSLRRGQHAANGGGSQRNRANHDRETKSYEKGDRDLFAQ
jgi:hypothetical protein